jgi:hypothetical protein
MAGDALCRVGCGALVPWPVAGLRVQSDWCRRSLGQAVSGAGAPVRVSPEGGRKPFWSRDGRTLYYENGPNLMSARVLSTTPSFAVSQPCLLVKGGFARDEADPHARDIDAAPDGRLIAVEVADAAAPPSIIVRRRSTLGIRTAAAPAVGDPLPVSPRAAAAANHSAACCRKTGTTRVRPPKCDANGLARLLPWR